MTRELSKQEFANTMGDKMINVTEDVEPIVDIWPYVSTLASEGIVLDYVVKNNLVEKVYRDSTNSFDHVLLPTENQNIFVIIVIELKSSIIYGHFNLDLNAEYGL